MEKWMFIFLNKKKEKRKKIINGFEESLWVTELIANEKLSTFYYSHFQTFSGVNSQNVNSNIQASRSFELDEIHLNHLKC